MRLLGNESGVPHERLAPHNVALACNRHGAALIHFSTNFVFDGRKEEPYVEVDEPSPLSVYGRSKLEGERQVLQSGATALIIRTAAVFGGGVNFPMRVLGRARSGERLRIVADQKVNPTYAKDLAAAAVELWEGVSRHHSFRVSSTAAGERVPRDDALPVAPAMAAGAQGVV